MQPFENEPLTNFADAANAARMKEALDLVRGQLGRTYDLIVDGERHETGQLHESVNPSDLAMPIGKVHRATKELAERSIERAHVRFAEWAKVPAQTRAGYLLKAAEILRRRKFEFGAWMVFETGKNWVEADADVAETIDFLEYYAREAVRWDTRDDLTPIPGEKNTLNYIPLGVGVVIPPWNFPLAILAGMTTAALVSGNTVVLKPSSESMIIGAKFFELMQEAGLPEGVLNFVPGAGSAVGDTLVTHALTRFIAFTGSKPVGLRINKLAADVVPGQIWIKRVVLEMGGKDAILVDASADVEAAAEGAFVSAWGFQGQKCSACSRLIVHQDVYDAVLERLVARTKEIRQGVAWEQANYMGPVISKSAYDDILQYIEVGKGEGRLLTGGGRAEGNGYYIQPTIIADVNPGARIAQEEIFGPVLAVIKARDWADCLAIGNGTEFGLTGAAYSQDRAHLDQAAADFHVGNLYLNRKCTGALVGGQPFGGFNMSGTDSKAGGADYLGLFLQAKSISEKV